MIKNLKKLRLERGISQRELAECVGTSQQSINKYENHEVEPNLNMLMRLAEYFETSVDYLVGYTGIDHIIEEIQPFDLNDDEAALLEEYRRLSKRERDSIRIIIDNYLNKENR